MMPLLFNGFIFNALWDTQDQGTRALNYKHFKRKWTIPLWVSLLSITAAAWEAKADSCLPSCLQALGLAQKG